nr:hypothetical protein [Tanacetum cinerariifolium]
MEEIDLPFTLDDPMPPGIEEEDYDSERDIPILEELLNNYSLSLHENESYHFDIPSSYRHPAKPPDGNTGILNIKMMGEISDQKICESNFHYGYECLERVPLVYEPEPCYIQKFSNNDYSRDLPGINPLIDHHCCYECGNSLNDYFCHECTYEFCGNGAHVCYNYPAQVPFFQTLPSFPQQYPCCEDCGVLPEADQCQPPQYTVNHPIFNVHNDFLHSQNELIEQMTQLTSIMGDEHLNTILAMESNKFIKSCVENLVPNPSESEGENGCDVPACFTTFSNILFDVEYEFNSSDDQSLSDEDFPEEIYLNPLFEEEINSMRIDHHHFNAESDLIESLLNRDSSIVSSSKIDSLLDEFAGELTLLKSIWSGIDETDCYPEEDIHLIERLFDSFMKEIDLSFNPDDPMPPGIEEDDDDSERDILILEELPSNYSISLPCSRKCEDSYQMILSSKSSFPQLQLGI